MRFDSPSFARGLRRLHVCAFAALICLIAAFGVRAAPAPCSLDTRSEKIGGGTVVYDVVGTGPVVLLIHGLFADKEQWSPLACRLAAAGYRALALDLPGYGQSDGFPIGDYRLERQADLVHALMARLAVARLDIAGNSMGGAIAALYAMRYPSEVRSIAFLGASLGIIEWASGIQDAIFAGMNPFIPVDVTQLDVEMRLLFVAAPAISDAGKRALVDGYVTRNLHYVQAWNIINLYDDLLLRATPENLPALIVWGEDDRVYDIAGAQRLQRRIAGSQLHRMANAGHLLHFENAAEVAPIYTRFLADASSAASAAPRPTGVTRGNPASQNCVDRGGTPTIEKNPAGGEFGVCFFPDNLQCEEWAMLRGDCRNGGIKVTGYVTAAARYCAITGGSYRVTAASNTPDERGECTLRNGATCDAAAYFAGTCTAQPR